VARKRKVNESISSGDEMRKYAASFASLGGKARAKKLTAEQRREIARKAVKARWARSKGGTATQKNSS
jgi:hypothetical protein